MGSAQSQPGLAEVATQLPSAILERAADLISKPSAWTQAALARRADGVGAPLDGDDAVCWCAEGAIARVVGSYFNNTYELAENILMQALDGAQPSIWNDTEGRTQAEVVAKLREAAALAREQGQ